MSETEAQDGRRRLELVPVGGVSMEFFPPLRRALDARFGTRSEVGAPLPVYPEWRDERTGRVSADAVLDALIARAEGEGDGRWVLGVAEDALHAPGLPRVFGEATVGGCCAVVGVGGLDDGRRREQTALLERVVREAVHELGHVAGLEHCADPECVMYPSRDIADTDRKATDFCRRCHADFSQATLDSARICD